ncbi:MAG TPA: cupin domain-containing protein [Burkholderiales bacterium]|nr:cupin domain-containing protein [Burkholderiales bacterium]
MIWRVRRVLTGHDAAGKSIVLMDGLAPNIKEMASMPGLALTDLWETRGAPARNTGSADNAARPVRLEPPKNGTILRIVEFPPDSQWRDRADARAAFDSIGAGHAPDTHSADPMMHKTATVDYIIVLKGEIYAIMDKGETLLKPGDILVQRGTNHSWSVRGTEPCIIAAILVSAAPLGAKRPARTAAKRPAKRPARQRARASVSPRAAARKRGKTGKR